MSDRPGIPLPSALKQPLRDALRGLAGVAGVADDALEPVKEAMPQQLREALSSALHSIRGAGKDMIGPHVDQADIRRAADFLGGRTLDPADIDRCAKVLAFAWDHLPADRPSQPLLSETLTTARLAHLKSTEGATRWDHAAEVLSLLRRSHVAGGFPGLSGDLPTGDQDAVDARLFALALWLLADRAQSMGGELDLLDMSMALTKAFGAKVRDAMTAPETLGSLLKYLTEHL